MRRILYPFLALALVLSSAPAASAAALTETQIQAIVSLISSFGADASIISNVNASLRGQPTTNTTSPTVTPSSSASDPRIVGSTNRIPTITSISPSSASADSTVTISGTNLNSGGNPKIEFYSSSGTFVGAVFFINTNYLSADRIIFNVNAMNAPDGSNLSTLPPGTYQVRVLTPTGRSNAVSLTVTSVAQTPGATSNATITSLSHSSATARTVVTIYGTNLLNPINGETTYVTFLKNGVELGGIPADTLASTNTRLIFAIEDSNLTRFAGATHLFVRRGGLTNSPRSNTVAFSIPATPTITSVSPTTASVGQATVFTITGTNFSGATVEYTNTGSGYSGTITPTSSSATSISFSAVPSAAGIIYFNVKNSDGRVSEKKIVTVGTPATSAPVIDVVPSHASATYGGTVSFTWNVTPTSGTTCQAAGNGLGGGSGAISTYGGWTTPRLYTNTTYGIRCTNAGGTTYKYVPVTVAQQADVTTPTTANTSVSAPVITITSPSSANPSIGYGETVRFEWNVTPTSGTTCQAAGTGINGTTGSGAVNLTGTWTTPRLYANTSYGIRCVGSTGLTTTRYVNVSVAQQTSVQTPPPSLTSVSPTSVAAGTPTTFTLSGANFSGAVVHYTNSATGYSGTLSPTSSSASSLTFNATPSTAGTITFYVRNSDGKASESRSVTITAAQTTTTPTSPTPTISSISPDNGRESWTTTFTISGSNFSSGAVVQYTVPASPAAPSGYSGTITPTSISATSVTFSVTAPAARPMTFVVRNNDGKVSGPISVTMHPAPSLPQPTTPTISSVTPTSAQAGTSVTFVVSGSNFSSGSVILYTNSATGYSGTLSPSYNASTGQLSITVTPSTAGTITFSVRNADGQTSGSSSVTITSAQSANVWSAVKSLFAR